MAFVLNTCPSRIWRMEASRASRSTACSMTSDARSSSTFSLISLRKLSCFPFSERIKKKNNQNPADEKKRISAHGILGRIFLAELAGNNPLHIYIIREELRSAKWVLHTQKLDHPQALFEMFELLEPLECYSSLNTIIQQFEQL